MRALTVRPGTPDWSRIVDVPEVEPGPHEVLVQTLAVGNCGTDREILFGESGEPPPGDGALEQAGPGWLRRIVTRRVPLDEWPAALEKRRGDVKTAVELAA